MSLSEVLWCLLTPAEQQAGWIGAESWDMTSCLNRHKGQVAGRRGGVWPLGFTCSLTIFWSHLTPLLPDSSVEAPLNFNQSLLLMSLHRVTVLTADSVTSLTPCRLNQCKVVPTTRSLTPLSVVVRQQETPSKKLFASTSAFSLSELCGTPAGWRADWHTGGTDTVSLTVTVNTVRTAEGREQAGGSHTGNFKPEWVVRGVNGGEGDVYIYKLYLRMHCWVKH